MADGMLQTRVQLKPQRSCQNRKGMTRKQKLGVKMTVKWPSRHGVPKSESMSSKGNSREIFKNNCPEISTLKDNYKPKFKVLQQISQHPEAM